MARSSLTDYLQNYPFWLMDVAPIEPAALPIVTPLLGFSSITAPEIQVEFTEIAEANWFFNRKVLKRADTPNVTLIRASKWFDADFYKWMMVALFGNTGGVSGSNALAVGGATPRRDLLLVHFMSRNPISDPSAQATAAGLGLLALQGTATAITGGIAGAGGVGALTTLGAGIAAGVGASASLGPFEVAPRLPAKAWVLYGCLPARYKAAGDFDGSDSSISLQELEIAVEHWDELTLGGTTAAATAAAIAIADARTTE